MAKPKFATLYSEELNASANFATINNEQSMTQQSDAEETDINVILAKYKITGQIPAVLQEGAYGDFSEVGTYREAMDKINAANAAFMALPAKIRDQFKNDPGAFVDFVTNPDNIDEIKQMGLAREIETVQNPPTPAPTPAPTEETPK